MQNAYVYKYLNQAIDKILSDIFFYVAFSADIFRPLSLF